MIKLSIIIVNFESSLLTVKCLDSLWKKYRKEFLAGEYEIVVVDNDSKDRSYDTIKNHAEKWKYTNIIFLKTFENRGFGFGCNFGALQARGEYLLFLNNDTLVHDRSFINMLGFADSNRTIGVVGGQLVSENLDPQVSYGSFFTILKLFTFLFIPNLYIFRSNSVNSIHEVDWVSGGLMLIRKSIFMKHNGFDDQIFMYVEDMEFCYRIKSSGYKVLYYPNASIIHKQYGSSTKSAATFNIYKSLPYFYVKHRPRYEYFILILLLYMKAIIFIIIAFSTSNLELKDLYLKSIRNV